MIRRTTVLDIETIVDPEAVALLPPVAARAKTRHGRWTIHKIVAAAVFIYDWRAGSRAPNPQLYRFGCFGESERELILSLDDFLADPSDPTEELVTFNGAAHDLPILRHRGMKYETSLRNLAGWCRVPEHPGHVDLLRSLTLGVAPKPTLVDACAGLGIAGVKSAIAGTSAARLVAAGRLKDLANACAQDVVATFLLRCRLEAFLKDKPPREDQLLGLLSWLQRQSGATYAAPMESIFSLREDLRLRRE